jgi:hypothetical protein
MKEKIINHVEIIFEDAPTTKAAHELKEELLSNSLSKYDDLISGGENPEAAYKAVISGMGDVSGLIEQLNNKSQMDPKLIEKSKIRSAVLVAIAIMLFILSVIPLIVASENPGYETLGLAGLLLMVSIGVALLVFNSMAKPKYLKKEETVVEDFKQWQAEKTQKKTFRAAVSTLIWTITVTVYFIISFLSDFWHITWVIFLIAAALEAFITLMISMRSREKNEGVSDNSTSNSWYHYHSSKRISYRRTSWLYRFGFFQIHK